MTKILITGASGFVGQAVCRQAVQQGFVVSGAVRKPREQLAGAEQIVIGGITRTTDWMHALREVDVVVHLAARVHVMHDSEVEPLVAFRAINVDGTLNLARQAAMAGVKRFVFISSIGVNGSQTKIGRPFSEADGPSPHNAYSLSKWEAEQGLIRLADETGLAVVIIRPPLIYGYNAPGNFGTLLRVLKRGWPLPLGVVHNQRSLVALGNVVDFIILCSTHTQARNQTFLVSDGHDLSTTELVRTLAQASGMPARLLPVPVWALRAAGALLGKDDAVQRLCSNLQIDISKARNLLGWVPPVSVNEGMKLAIGI